MQLSGTVSKAVTSCSGVNCVSMHLCRRLGIHLSVIIMRVLLAAPGRQCVPNAEHLQSFFRAYALRVVA